MSTQLIIILLAAVIVLLFLFFLSYPNTLIRLKLRKKTMDKLATKYGLKNWATLPTLRDWLTGRRVDINTINGNINNHHIKIIDSGHFSLNIKRWRWRSATLIDIDGKIVDDSYKSWRQKVGFFSYLLPIKKIEEMITKET